MLGSEATLSALSDEILLRVLDFIEDDLEKAVGIERRAYLSIESFRAPKPPPRGSTEDFKSFRLLCRRFANVAISHQFKRITIRFSRRGFERLNNIAKEEHLGRNVKTLTYMLPGFYGFFRVEELFEVFPPFPKLDPNYFLRNAQEQSYILQRNQDITALNRAMKSFTSLQHFKLLPILDHRDVSLRNHVQRHSPDALQYVQFDWPPACIHGIRTIGAAITAAASPCNKFSGFALDSGSAVLHRNALKQTLPLLASRLTCLELHFYDDSYLDENITRLSNLFESIFSKAGNMQAIYVGFPVRQHLGLGLEEIFHNVRWERLETFGIQGWRLDADEIIKFVRRHRNTLKHLRLRDVLLKDGSLWKDVLGMLRDEVDQLEWVSLRRISYVKGWNVLYHGGGVDVTDDMPGTASESDDDGDFWDHFSAQDDQDDDATTSTVTPGPSDSMTEGDDTSSDEADSDDDDDNAAPSLDLDVMTIGPASTGERQYHFPDSKEGLEDNGIDVSTEQRRMWEKWILH